MWTAGQPAEPSETLKPWRAQLGVASSLSNGWTRAPAQLSELFSTEVLVVADEISLSLFRDQALVLFDWPARTSEGGEPSGFVDQAEQRVLSDIEAALETKLTEPLVTEDRARLQAARDRIRDTED